MYKIIEIVTIGQLAKDMEAAEKEGYTYVGASANPGGSTVFMHKRLTVGEPVPEQHTKDCPEWERLHGELPDRFGYENMTKVANLVREAVITDGGHHKQWYLEQIAERLELSLPEHDEGIAP